jgi:hypothetical protein
MPLRLLPELAAAAAAELKRVLLRRVDTVIPRGKSVASGSQASRRTARIMMRPVEVAPLVN